jgi:hypothetical protein
MNTDFAFSFEIGEIVTTKESNFTWKMRRSTEAAKSQPLGIQIISRTCEQCPGGVQYHYRCQYFTNQGYLVSDFNEVALMAYPTDEVQEWLKKP